MAGRKGSDAPAVVRRLVDKALADAWLPDGGLAYTLHYEGRVDVGDRYWWPLTEAISVVATLLKLRHDQDLERWYQTLWRFAAQHFVDRDRAGWFPEIDREGRPVERQFRGKPDIYHALQADLFPLAPGVSRMTGPGGPG